MTHKLPQGWVTAPLASVIDGLQPGFASGKKNVEGGIAHLRMNNVGLRGELVLDLIRTVPDKLAKPHYDLQAGDVLVCTTNTGKLVGKCAYFDLPGRYAFSNHLTRLRPTRGAIDGRLLRWNLWLNWQRGLFDDKCKHWVNQSTLPREALLESVLLVPPLAEQHRIIERLQDVLEKVDSSRDRLARIPTILKRFRQSVLAAACSGRLTEDWRERHQDVEPGSELLRTIRTRRAAVASKKELGQLNEAFSEPKLRPGDDELGLTDLPESWVACRIGAVGAVSNGSTPSRKVPAYWGGDIPWVSSGEVRNNIITTTRECISKAGYDGSSVRMLQRGTVLLAMIGEGKTRGQSALLGIEATINQNIAAVVLSHGLVKSEYLWRWFQLQYETTREQGGGSGPQALNCERVRELPFVLPPFAEQEEVVRRVEAMFAFADKIESKLAAATAQVDRLTPSLLAKAFRGELAPTEAELAEREGREYETADELLQRIAAERQPSRTQESKTKRKPRTVVSSSRGAHRE